MSGVVAEVEAVVSLAEVPGVVVGVVGVVTAAVVRVVVFGFLPILMRRDMIVWFGVMVSAVGVVVSGVVIVVIVVGSGGADNIGEDFVCNRATQFC